MAFEDPIEAVRFYLHNQTAPYKFTDDAIQEFLDLEKRVDKCGYAIDSPNWTPTYDVLRAAGRGYLWLYAKVGATAGYKVGDVSVVAEKNFYMQQARMLMGAGSAIAERRDEMQIPRSPRFRREI